MAEAEPNDSTDRCLARTEDGERCSRPATEDDFCYQHDESDQSVSDSQTMDDEQTQEQSQASDAEGESETDESRSRQLAGGSMTADERTDPDTVDTDEIDAEEEIAGVLAVRRTVQSTAGDLIGREFDAVSEITPTDEGWRAVVEVVERRSVPDTQDVIGRYEIELDESATVHGYRRLDRYRRGDTTQFE